MSDCGTALPFIINMLGEVLKANTFLVNVLYQTTGMIINIKKNSSIIVYTKKWPKMLIQTISFSK